MQGNTENTIFEHLSALVGRFDQPSIQRKSVEVAPGIELRFSVLERSSFRVLVLMETLEEKVCVFASRIAVFKGFARGVTLEQFGEVIKRGDSHTVEGWTAYMEINAFLSDWLNECCQSARIEALKAKAALRVA